MMDENSRKGVTILKDRIRTIRTGLGLTQKEFAARIGTSQNVLANYETGRRNPSSSVINNICKTFHINEPWLRAGEGPMSAEVGMEQKIIAWVKNIFAKEEMTFQKRFLQMLMGLDGAKWELLEEMMQNTMGNLPGRRLPQEEENLTVSDAEAAYIKSRSKSAARAASPVSSITEEGGSAAQKKKID